jgi:DNA-binding response OmpR family regulator
MPRILISEQRPEYRRQLTALLKGLVSDIQIESPESIVSVTETLRFQAPNLLIVDPFFDEKASTQIFADYPLGRRSFPILLLMPVDANPKMIDSWLALGADDFVTKPLEEHLLKLKVKALITKASPTANVYYGNDEGLAPVVFTFGTKIEQLTEDEIQFLAPVLIARETRIKISIGDLKVPALIREVTRRTEGVDANTVHVYSTAAKLETFGQFNLQVAIRKYIRDLEAASNSKGSGLPVG